MLQAVSSSLIISTTASVTLGRTQVASRCWRRNFQATSIGLSSGMLVESVDPKAMEVLHYWLGPVDAAKPNSFPAHKVKLWFKAGEDVDKDMKARFGHLLQHAAKTGLPEWQRHHNGLAAVLLMDQFSRNVYRGAAQVYDLDAKAMMRAQQLLDSGDAAQFVMIERLWLVLPFMHSEKLHDQQAAVRMVKDMLHEVKSIQDSAELQNYLQLQLGAADAHVKVIQQWGRFPHRNALLGRTNTPEEEQAFAEGSIPSF